MNRSKFLSDWKNWFFWIIFRNYQIYVMKKHFSILHSLWLQNSSRWYYQCILESRVKKKIWMQQFHNFESNNLNKAYLLKKIIYDFKQSVKMWYETLKNFFINIDYVKFFFDHFVFIHENNMIIAVYVNDLLLIESKFNDVFNFKNKLMI